MEQKDDRLQFTEDRCMPNYLTTPGTTTFTRSFRGTLDIDALIQDGKWEAATTALADGNLKPYEDASKFNLLLRAVTQKGTQEEMWNVISAMVDAGIRLDSIHCNIICQELCKGGRLEEVVEFMDHMTQGGVPISANLFNMLIMAQVQQNLMDDAKQTIELMEEAELEPNEATLNHIITGIKRRGGTPSFENIQFFLDKYGGNPQTMCIIFEILLQNGMEDEIPKVFEIFKGKGIAPTTEAFNVMMKYCESANRSYAVLRSMEISGCAPDKYTIYYLVRDGVLSTVDEVRRMLEKNGLQLDGDLMSGCVNGFIAKSLPMELLNCEKHRIQLEQRKPAGAGPQGLEVTEEEAALFGGLLGKANEDANPTSPRRMLKVVIATEEELSLFGGLLKFKMADNKQQQEEAGTTDDHKKGEDEHKVDSHQGVDLKKTFEMATRTIDFEVMREIYDHVYWDTDRAEGAEERLWLRGGEDLSGFSSYVVNPAYDENVFHEEIREEWLKELALAAYTTLESVYWSRKTNTYNIRVDHLRKQAARIWVSGISPYVGEETLANIFGQYGTVTIEQDDDEEEEDDDVTLLLWCSVWRG
eukprot:jgi/Bigna1/129019/aug1.8_g3727